MQSRSKILDEFLESRNITDSSKKLYRIHLKNYEDFTGKSLDELIEEAEDEEDQGIRLRKRKVKKYLTEYRKYLEKKGYSENYIRTDLTILRGFYNEYDIELPKSRVKIERKNSNDDINNLPTTDDILKALTFSNLKFTAIILLMVSSGMASAEIRNLTYRDFVNAVKSYLEKSRNSLLDIYKIADQLREKEVVPEWHIKRKKTKNYFYTFSSPESTRAILDYLEVSPPKKLDDPLFRSKGKKISELNFSTYFKRLNERCNFGKRGRQIYFRSHNLRKIFATKLYSAGLSQLTIDFLIAHRLNPITEAYFKADPSKLKSEYLKVLDNLTFREKVKVTRVESKEYQELFKKNLEMEKKQQVLERMVKELMEKQLK